ncbi:MAG: nucleotidyltransferase family protein [Dehalococcoidales bacterium]|nr:nucleotidyltransferase family protein [Dehalococcoidales bacterium]
MSIQNISNKTALILLAGGMARRMGSLKQLLPLGYSTIMGITLDNVMASNAEEVIVVVGAMAEKTSEIAKMVKAEVVNNPDYMRGMSTSLRQGLGRAGHDCQLFMIALADQPLTETKTYNLLLREAGASSKGITIPVYHGQQGNPIVFKRRYLWDLLSLKGDVGGRELLLHFPEDILKVEVNDPGVLTNINTPADYELLKLQYAKRSMP